ncbi:NAD(P)H-binding protein [Actinomadura sp. HBU206391]|uniref:NAD(P)H-binding protein n=1 Tax=Actinomadura sp. HBU206391 TaxID=2731692 RepID=UPI0016505989|nr:NAD(P)H-binding protein [Actinomadura sp. HBU206391]MBC6457116.1 NAD(P)H-binding protein [Actinomadura sp. HBU206391]
MFLVTGATGNVGRHVVSQLSSTGAAVRALTRDPGAARLPDGVEVVRGDLSEPGGLGAALAGVESVFLVWPTLSADHAAPATLETIAKHARRVVYLSARGVPDASEDQTAESILGSHARIERLIERSGMEWTFLRPGGFATNTLAWAPQIRAGGVVRWIHGKAGRSLIHERDIAAVAARVLTEDGHATKKYELTGPETLTQIEQVHAIGTAIGRPLRFEEFSLDAARQQMLAQGMPPDLVDPILNGHAAMVSDPESVTDAVEELTGTPARTYLQWAIDHADDFR